MGPVEVCNIALAEVGNRVQINSFSDTTPQAQAARLFYTPKVQMLMRAAPWDCLRAQINLAQLKAAYIAGAPSTNPPPQPWQYEYSWPTDCLRARFLIPTYGVGAGGIPLTTAPNVVLPCTTPPTAVPFVPGTDNDANGNPIKVILTNLFAAQLIYTKDLSQYPDLWDSMLLTAATATLAAYFINALARDKAQMSEQVAIAKNAVEQARSVSGNESISSVDHIPDWMQARQMSAVSWGWNQTGPNGVIQGPWWDSCEMPGGLFF